MNSVKMSITDPVYGSIPLSDLQLELIQTVEVQRLNSIHQLGMTYQVYPSAHSMRFAHALGVSHLADRMGRQLILENDTLELKMADRKRLYHLLIASALLHDVCHTPWSHTLEPLLLEVTGKDHMEMTRELLTGEIQWPVRGSGRIPEILSRHDVNPVDAAAMISRQYKGPYYLQQMIFGEVDADTLDYLCRDFHSTGVNFGHVDVDRLLQTMVVRPERLFFMEKGLQAVRDFLNARIEMYSAVYLHKKTRIADLMFLRAARKCVVEHRQFTDFWTMTDDEFLSRLLNEAESEYVRDIAWRLKYRQDLFKRVFHMEAGSLEAEDRQWLQKLNRLGRSPSDVASELERIICSDCQIPEGYVIVDLVSAATDLSESRFKELDIVFIDKAGRTVKLAQIDRHFAEYIRQAQPSRSILSVYVPDRWRDKCGERLPGILRHIADKGTRA